MKDDEIKVKIAQVAKEEFLELGYVDASMRNISAKAGLTTGSLYNRFRDKAELFEYIVGDSASEVFDRFRDFNKTYEMKNGNSEVIVDYETSAIKYLFETMFDNYDSFDLIINKGLGSPYENFLDRLTALATENAKNYVFAHKPGLTDPTIAEDLTNLLNVALFNAIAEVFRKHYSREEASFFMKNLFTFYHAGWDAVLAE